MNIKDAILELVEAGFSEGRIAKEVGNTTQPTIHRIKTGNIKNPRFDVGSRIMALHRAHFGKKNSTASAA